MEIGVLFSCVRHCTWIAHGMAWIFSDMFFPTTRSVHHFMKNNDVGLNLDVLLYIVQLRTKLKD